MKFRTGPHLGIPYEVALGLGLSSALKGRSYYDTLTHTLVVTTPSERLLGHQADVLVTDDCATPHTGRCCQPALPIASVPSGDPWDVIAAMRFCISLLAAPHTSILKPARKEKPE